MSKERYSSRNKYGDSTLDTSFLYDDIERIRVQEEEIEKNEANKLGFAGMIALIAGLGLVISGAVFGIIPASIFEFLNAALPVVGAAGIGYGFYKTLKLVVRRKQLSFPSLNVYRKKRPAKARAKASTSSQQEIHVEDASTSTRTRPEVKFRRPSSRTSSYTRRRGARTTTLSRSRTNRIFSGVAGGISEYTGISPALIRFAFIAATFMSSGMFVFVYLLLSIILPSVFERKE